VIDWLKKAGSWLWGATKAVFKGANAVYNWNGGLVKKGLGWVQHHFPGTPIAVGAAVTDKVLGGMSAAHDILNPDGQRPNG
jgi:hypothetical protein